MTSLRQFSIALVCFALLNLVSCHLLGKAPAEFWRQLEQAKSTEQMGKILDDYFLNGKFQHRQKYQGRDIGYGHFRLKDGFMEERDWSGCSNLLEINPRYPAKFTVTDNRITGSSEVCCNCGGLGPWTHYEYDLLVYAAEELKNVEEKTKPAQPQRRVPFAGSSIGTYSDGSNKVYEIGGYIYISDPGSAPGDLWLYGEPRIK